MKLGRCRSRTLAQQVLGNFKLVMILTAGVLVFEEEAEPLRLLGTAFALASIVGYTTLKQGLGSDWEGNGNKNTTDKEVAETLGKKRVLRRENRRPPEPRTS